MKETLIQRLSLRATEHRMPVTLFLFRIEDPYPGREWKVLAKRPLVRFVEFFHTRRQATQYLKRFEKLQLTYKP